MKTHTVVMPAWIAGIQARKDAAGDIRVNLDSSTPCWNDGIERALLEPPKPRTPIFEGDLEGHESFGFVLSNFVIFAFSFVVQ